MVRRAVIAFAFLYAFAAHGEDFPNFKVGGTLFADYTYAQSPRTKDADGNLVHGNSFNVARGYINVTANVSKYLFVRITPDIARETGTSSSLSGSQEYRLKFAFAQANLDQWWGKGGWARFGVQPTPFNDHTEQFYRYRFQGPIFEDREGLSPAADGGIAAHYNFPGDHGDVMGGIYNGETFTKAETNNEKSVQIRATWRPLPAIKGWSALRLTGFVNEDHYMKGALRRRQFAQVIYDHPRMPVGFDLVRATDQRNGSASRAVDSEGYTVWATPRLGHGWELLVRRDELKPDTAASAKKKRDIEGIAYWFPMPKGISTALLLDRDDTRGIGPRQTNYAVHMLLSF